MRNGTTLFPIPRLVTPTAAKAAPSLVPTFFVPNVPQHLSDRVFPLPNLVLRARPPSHRNATHVVNHISTKETVDAKVAQLTHHYSSDSETMSL